MTPIHRYLGVAIMVLFVVLALWGGVLRVLGRGEAPPAMWAVQHWTENLLAVQVVLGVVLLVIGRRVVGDPLIWLHYLYGSVFPLMAIIGGRIASLRRQDRDYVGLSWGAFFAFGLTLRALQTGCGGTMGAVARCLGL